MTRIPPIRVVITGVDRLSKKLGASMARMNRIGAGMQNFGRSMSMGVTMPTLLAGAAIVKTASSFQGSMNKVKALTQATGKPLEDMTQLAKKLGSETQFSATQAADAMAFLGMAGWKTNEILAGTPAILDLAAASQTDLARTADIASNIMGAFQLEATDMTRVADVLATTTASANVDMEMLAETMKAAGPIAHAAGASLEDAAAAAGFLGNVGIQGSQAGTAMKNMFVRLAAPAGKAAQMLGAMGVKTKDAEGNLRPYATILGEVSTKLSTLGTGQKLEVLDAIFGKRAIAGVAAMTGDMRKMNSGFARLGETLGKTEGRAKEMADIMMEGAPGAFKRFISALEGAAIAIADSGLLDLVAKFAIKFANFFKKISETSPRILKFGTIIAGLAAVIGPLILMIGGMVSSIATIGGAVASAGGVIALLSNPIGWIIAAIVATIGMVTLLVKNFDTGFGKILIAINPFAGVVAWIITRWKRILPFFKLIFYGIAALIKWMSPVFKPFIFLLKGVGQLITNILDGILGIMEKLANLVLPDWLKKKIGLDVKAIDKRTAEEGNLHARGGFNSYLAGIPGMGAQPTTVNLKIEDKAGTKLTAETEQGDVNTEVHKGLQNTGTE